MKVAVSKVAKIPNLLTLKTTKCPTPLVLGAVDYINKQHGNYDNKKTNKYKVRHPFNCAGRRSLSCNSLPHCVFQMNVEKNI